MPSLKEPSRNDVELALWLRFWSHVRKTPGCWYWEGSLNGKHGYGNFRVGGRRGKTIRSHVFAYEKCIGEIPKGLHLDHLCRQRNCVNPAHLEAVSCKENILRGNGACAVNARKTHCKHGHALSGANVYRRSDGYRECAICKKQKDWRRYATHGTTE